MGSPVGHDDISSGCFMWLKDWPCWFRLEEPGSQVLLAILMCRLQALAWLDIDVFRFITEGAVYAGHLKTGPALLRKKSEIPEYTVSVNTGG